MSNSQKALTWIKKSWKWASVGCLIGLLMGITGSLYDGTTIGPLTIVGFIFLGSSVGLVPPVLIAGWFLFLHMLGQVVATVKNPNQ
jgi:hypothetical protein